MDNENTRGSIISLPKNGTRLSLIFFIINFLIAFANLYLSNGYVSKAVYERDVAAAKAAYEKDLADSVSRREALNGELRGIAVELRGIKDHMQGDEKQDQRIQDHELRLREVEKRK